MIFHYTLLFDHIRFRTESENCVPRGDVIDRRHYPSGLLLDQFWLDFGSVLVQVGDLPRPGFIRAVSEQHREKGSRGAG